MEFKCKSCGSQLSFEEGQLSSKCESCGNTYMIFDFLDKSSKDYQEQVEAFQYEKRKYENLFQQYMDDVIEADSYCLKAKDFLKIIDFFESAKQNEQTAKLLDLAKIQFVKRVSSYNECLIAEKYIEEIDGSLINNKDELRTSLTDLAISFRRSELIDIGWAIEISDNKSENGLLSVLMFLSKNNYAKEGLQQFEYEIIETSRRNAIDYVNRYGDDIISHITSISAAQKTQVILNTLQKTYLISNCESLSNLTAQRIEQLQQEEEMKAAEVKKREQIEKSKRKKDKVCTISIAVIAAIVLICFIAYRIHGYSSSNISMHILSKTNDTYNENLASGYSGAGYFYIFTFEVDNNSPYDIELIRGNMEIVNTQGQTLSTSSVEMQGDLLKRSTQKWNIRLNVDKGNNAREIWNTDLDDLKITFKIKAIYFSDGTNKTYGDSKKTIIHEIGS